jgi:hypothetical protein
MAHAVHALPPTHRPDRSNVITAVAVLMALEAASLGVAAALHLSGLVHGRSASFDPGSAGIAEAVIGVVLAVAAIAMFRTPFRARAVGITATSFALVGFLVGITETARGGDVPDIAYHSTVIPLLIGGLVLLIRSSRPAPLPPT